MIRFLGVFLSYFGSAAGKYQSAPDDPEMSGFRPESR